MGSRTNFGIAVYHYDDLSNICVIMPSLSMKYFYPKDVQRGIVDNVKIDINEVLKDVSGWEGDSHLITRQNNLPTIIVLQGCDSTRGSFVFNYILADGKVYYRLFPFEIYKTVNIEEVEESLGKEAESGISITHTEEHEALKNQILIGL